MLAIVPLLAVLDSVAAGVAVFVSAMGTGTQSGTVSRAAADNRDALAAVDDYAIQETVTPVFARRASIVKADTLYQALQGAMLQRALDQHYGGANHGSLNRFLKAQDARVHPNLKLIGMQLDAENVFAPAVVDPVASYEGTGAGTGTFAAGSDIDTTQYGPSAMQVVVSAMGASTRIVRLTVRFFDGTTTMVDVTVPASSAPGTVLSVGAGRYVGVDAIITTNGGGTSADRLTVRSVIERTIAL